MDNGGNEEKLRQYLKRVTAELGQTRQRLQEVESQFQEPIAIVGMGCRLPGGVTDPDGLWKIVDDGIDTVSPFPTDRGWDLPEGGDFCYEAAMLHDAADFDHTMFGINPREALGMDPQQRLLLETSWEAIERAGIDARRLSGKPVGVYVGAVDNGYVSRLDEVPESIRGYRITGTSASVVSGRVAYSLGLEGPAVSVDTACSSSLTALHFAIQALRRGECELALAGGVSVLPGVDPFDDFSRQGGLAKNGRIKPFSSEADGTNWAEGVGVVLVERLSSARRNGHEVLAVLRGSAVNQDGASNGLSAPNDLAQERVINAALADADLGSTDVDVVEAHGTGTPLGDPLEAKALLNTYGQGRQKDDPLWLGSVKSNLGHSGACAGMTGVIKMVQALRHGVMPKTLHIGTSSPHVDWSAGQVELLRESRAWPARQRPRRGAVSGFGISGTNAHVIVEQAPAVEYDGEESEQRGLPSIPWVISGKSDLALRAQSQRLQEHIADGSADLRDVGYALATGRVPLEVRAAIVGDSLDVFRGGLAGLAEDGASSAVVRDQVGDGKVAFLFTGQGSQRAGMGRELYEKYPVFAAAWDEVCEHMDPHLTTPLREVVFEDNSNLINETAYTQPALFALEVALYRTMREWGVRPEYLNGHSIGEITAAHVAGVLSLPDACALVAARGRLMQELPADGAMVAIQASEEEVSPLLDERVSIATINGPRSVVVAGDEIAAAKVAAAFESQGRKTKRLVVSHAFHSPLMDAMLEDFRVVANSLSYAPPTIPIVSNLTGELATAAQLCDPEFWVRHVRETVRFAAGAQALAGAGVATFIELGPDGVLTTAVQDCVDDPELRCWNALRPNRSEAATITTLVAAAHTRGVTVDWEAFFAGTGACRTTLPTYAFQRQRFWAESVSRIADVSAAGIDMAEHGLLAGALSLADTDSWMFTGRLSSNVQSWLPDHGIAGQVWLPGAAFADMAMHAASFTECPRVAELTIRAALVVPDGQSVQLQVKVTEPDDDGLRGIAIYGKVDDPEYEWVCHAVGRLGPQSTLPVSDVQDAPWPPPGSSSVDITHFYDELDDMGYSYGPAFRCLRAAWRRDDELFYEIELSEAQAAETTRYGLHPALLDAALHAGMLGDPGEADGLRVPFTWSGLELFGAGASRVRVGSRVNEAGMTNVTIMDEQGAMVATLDTLELRVVQQQRASRRLTAADLATAEWEAADIRSVNVDWLSMPHEGITALPESVPPTVVITRDIGAEDPEIALREVLRIVQEWLADNRFGDSMLAFAISGHTPERAGVAALIRTACMESPGRIGLIHTQPEPSHSTGLAVAALRTGEPEVWVRAGQVFVPRLNRRDEQRTLQIPAQGKSLGARSGTFDLVDTDTATVPLEPGQVRVAVAAAGLNFRDLVIGMEMVSSMDGHMGLEGAGIVTEVASDVGDLAVGDRVMGMMREAMGPVSVGRAVDLMPMPRDWTFAQGASIPVAFLTVWTSLTSIAGVRSGDRVLIHAATGGVGLAAIQVARHLGAEVFVTASEPKQHLLRQMGFDEDHIASTRTLEFRERFLSTTNGAGMDVVLNTLAGEFTEASLDLMPDGGCFVELGKTDVRDSDAVASSHPGVRYVFFDLDPTRLGPEVRAGWERLVELFDSGDLTVPAMRTWPLSRAPEAIDQMQRAQHIGKIVFTMPRDWDPNGTVLITGGTGTLAGLLARHLVTTRGVRNLLLISRRGLRAPGAEELVADLEAAGARVEVRECDVADRNAVRDCLDEIPASRPLRAVIHTAGTVRDSVVTELAADDVAQVWRAKAAAARNLDELTRGMALDHFVLFSSLAGTTGSPGQANYAAANAYLDELARSRRREGLPALSLAWGMWARASGMTGHLAEQDRARLAATGMRPLGDDEALDLFDAAIDVDDPVLVPQGVDQRVLRQQYEAGNLPPIISGLIRRSSRGGPATRSTGPSLTQRLASLDAGQRGDALADVVREEAAAVLLVDDVAELGTDRPFSEMGIDSLTAVDLRNRLNKLTGLQLPASVVLDHPSVAELAAEIDTQLPQQPRTGAASPESRSGGLGGLLHSAAVDGNLRQVWEIGTGLAALRDEFTSADQSGDPDITTLRSGGDEVVVLCVPSFLGRPNPFHYHDLAGRLPATWTVGVMSLPGYDEDQALPATSDALTEALARAAAAYASERKLLLVGHSGGGLLAGGIAHRLERAASNLAGLVVLDSPQWNPQTLPQWLVEIYPRLSQLQSELGLSEGDDLWLTAESRYAGFDYTPAALATPVLSVQAKDLLEGLSYEKNGWDTVWPHEHELMEVPGDHFTMLDSVHSPAVAEAIVDWCTVLD